MCILCGLGEKEYMAWPVRIFRKKEISGRFGSFFAEITAFFANHTAKKAVLIRKKRWYTMDRKECALKSGAEMGKNEIHKDARMRQ